MRPIDDLVSPRPGLLAGRRGSDVEPRGSGSLGEDAARRRLGDHEDGEGVPARERRRDVVADHAALARGGDPGQVHRPAGPRRRRPGRAAVE